MNLDAESPARPLRAAGAAGLARLRRGSLAVLVLTVVEYGIGMYVNLYVTVPQADHGASVGSAITNGPATLSPHGVFALASADATGASFTSSARPADSMAMSVLTGVALLCYVANLYLLRPSGQRG